MLLSACVWASCGESRLLGFRRAGIAAPGDAPTGEFWIFADPQIHNTTGAATRSKSGLVDERVQNAIRPPSLDLWAEEVLAQVSQDMRVGTLEIPSFFLGDGANVSCIDEYVRFLSAMSNHPAWFGVMGNHDGYYMGNFTFEPRAASGLNSWQGACAIDGERHHREWRIGPKLDQLERALWKVGSDEETHVAQGVLTKSHAIWIYLEHLYQRGIITSDPLACDNWIPREWRRSRTARIFRCQDWEPRSGSHREFEATGVYHLNGKPLSIRVFASIDSATVLSVQRTQPWHSYLLQDVELADRNHAILLDTADYINAPPSSLSERVKVLLEDLIRSDCWRHILNQSLPGHCGEISSDQMRKAAELLQLAQVRWEEQRGQNAQSPQVERGAQEMRYFVLGHHPWHSLRRDSVDRLKRFLRVNPGFVTYLSAHAHLPTSTLGTDAKYHWEVNVGSTSDWPMEYAKISYWLPREKEPPALRVEVRSVRGSSDESCPYGGLTDLQAEEHERKEMNYQQPDAYVSRGLEVYRHIIAASIARHPKAEPAPRCWVSGLRVDLNVVLRELDKAAAAPAEELPRKRSLLDQVSECNRTVLRNLAGVSKMEVACAAWASKLEYDKNHKGLRIRLSEHDPETFQIRDVPAGP